MWLVQLHEFEYNLKLILLQVIKFNQTHSYIFKVFISVNFTNYSSENIIFEYFYKMIWLFYESNEKKPFDMEDQTDII